MLKTITSGPIEWNVQVAGSGPPLLFIHGFPFSRMMWHRQVAHLQAHFQCIVPDLPGFGNSPPVTQPLTVEWLADQLFLLLDQLQIPGPVAVCGLSMGGSIALQCALRHPARIERLILCNCRAAADDEATRQNRYKVAERVLVEGPEFLTELLPPRLFSPQTLLDHPELVDEVRQMIRTTPPAGVAAGARCLAGRPDVTSRLGEIEAPVLVVVGEDDVISPPQEMWEICGVVPSGTYVRLAGAGHLTPLEAPQEFNAALEHFLRG